MSNASQSPSFHLSKTPKQVLIKNNNKPTKKRSPKSKYKPNNNNNNDTTSFSNNNNNKPMKVVHISNPIRFQATAAEFRALVQGLTGRDAVIDDTHFFGRTHQAHHDGGGANSSSNDNNSSDDDKVVLLQHQHNDNDIKNNDNYHHSQDDYHHQQQQQQQEVNISAACFGQSLSHDDQLSFDYYDAFSNGADFVVMEDLRAFMDDYGQ